MPGYTAVGYNAHYNTTIPRDEKGREGKKGKMEKRDCGELELLGNRNMTRKCFQTAVFKAGERSCKDGLWRNHFVQLLHGGSSSMDNKVETDIPVVDDGIGIAPPELKEARIAISRVKNKKIAGVHVLPADLFKAGGEELTHLMHQLVKELIGTYQCSFRPGKSTID